MRRKRTEDIMAIIKMDFHRNGVCGLGFHVGIVREIEDGHERDMLVIRFPKRADEETGNVVCAAFDLAQLDKRVIEFGPNSWRGDHYSDCMDVAIAAEHAARHDKDAEEQRIRDYELRVPL